MKTAYEVCPSCGGAGLQDGIWGPVSCYSCRGWCVIRLRDERGRFTTAEVLITSKDGI